MRVLCLLALVAACGRSADSAVEPGVLLVDVPADATRDAIAAKVANEIEILKSRVFVERLVEQLDAKQMFGADREVAVQALQRAIRARRRGDGTAIEIGLAKMNGVDPTTTVMICNRLMEELLSYHRADRMMLFQQREMVVAQELDELEKRAGSGTVDPHATALESKLREIESERAMMQNDIRLVDPCRMRGSSR